MLILTITLGILAIVFLALWVSEAVFVADMRAELTRLIARYEQLENEQEFYVATISELEAENDKRGKQLEQLANHPPIRMATIAQMGDDYRAYWPD